VLLLWYTLLHVFFFPIVVIMSSQPTVVAHIVVVHVLCGLCGDMLWEAHWLVVQHNNAQ